MLKILVLLVLALVTLRGLYLLNGSIRVLRRAGSSLAWPKAQGVVARTEDTRHDLVYSSQAIVHYTASDGQAYSTDLVSFGETLNPFDRAVGGLLRFRYPDGARVSVSYDPSDPGTAVLQPGRHAGAFWPVGVSLAFLLPAALCLTQLSALSGGVKRSSESSQTVRDLVDRARREGVQDIDVARQMDSTIPTPGFGVGAIIAATLASFACAGGVLLLASGLAKTYYGFASQSWPTTPGEVTVNVGLREMSARQQLHNTVILPPPLLYRYEVAGIDHVNSVRRFQSVKRGDNMEQAKNDAPEDLPVGRKVTVSYFPDDPDVSALEPGNDGSSYVLPGIGMFLLLVSFSVFIWAVPSFR